MLDSCTLDFVAIATDSGSHARIATDCLERGISVLVEKPMALDLNDADSMIELAEKRDVMLAVSQQNRFNDASKLVRAALDSGAFGVLSHVSVQVRWSRDRSYYGQGSWRGTWAKDGGALMNQCIHGLDLMRWFGGSRIERVWGTVANRYHPYLEVEDIGIGQVEFSNGALGTLEGTTNVYQRNLEERLTIIGERGTTVLGGECAQEIEFWRFADAPQGPEAGPPLGSGPVAEGRSSVYGTSHLRVYEDCMRAWERHEKPMVDGHAGRDALELVLAVYKSHLDKAPVHLPLYDFGTQKMHL